MLYVFFYVNGNWRFYDEYPSSDLEFVQKFCNGNPNLEYIGW